MWCRWRSGNHPDRPNVGLRHLLRTFGPVSMQHPQEDSRQVQPIVPELGTRSGAHRADGGHRPAARVGLHALPGSARGGRRGGFERGLNHGGLVLVQHFFSHRLVLWSTGATLLPAEAAPELHAMVERLSARAGIPDPQVALMPARMPNRLCHRTQSAPCGGGDDQRSLGAPAGGRTGGGTGP